MILVKSSSGIRGTLGGRKGMGFTPFEVIQLSVGFVSWMKIKYKKNKKKYLIISGRDGRGTSKLLQNILINVLQCIGVDVIDIGLSTTPTVGISVVNEKADGGMMVTASHNPKNWNGLKLFDSFGEFLSGKEFKKLFLLSEQQWFPFAPYKKLGKYLYQNNCIQKHVDKILSLPIIDVNLIRKLQLKIVVDGINSTGGIAVPILLKRLGVEIVKIYCNPNGEFMHNPEPIQRNLKEICKKVPDIQANMGISVDPDVDRVVFICENGDFFGEEYTLVSIADFVLENTLGPVVSTLSSSYALKDLSIKKNVPFYETPVGEINVINKMKETNAVIGGEGNGGIIYPNFRYGRDALVGIALFLTQIAKKSSILLSELKKKYFHSFISKKKIQYAYNHDILFRKIKEKYIDNKMDFSDGIKIYYSKYEWTHVRKSNTENILRIYSESISKKRSDSLSKNMILYIKNFISLCHKKSLSI
ncbi:phosphohexomutase domain-containing protein [Blattabacterium cuenoti]|uniref:phosphoglucosamine mutase n=1 Tax=Blattabacterium cuenoti TaxID=1653831 RepID=UPI00163B8CBF|nr:phosphoglucosamine mutase [Blattabacterium cuenoti]